MIAIVDYGLGNLGSVANMVRRAGGEAVVTSSVACIDQAKGIILPGVGSFDAGICRLHELDLVTALHRRVQSEGTPILGICLGFQLMGSSSEEGVRSGLGWIPAEVKRLQPKRDLPLPHMGWNDLILTRADPLLANLTDSRFYFVHNYHVVCRDNSLVVAETDYDQRICAAVRYNNIFATQFHPEKSHRFGLTLIKNFLSSVYAA